MVRRTRNKQLNSVGQQNSTSIDKTTPENSDEEVHVMAAAAQEHLDGVKDSLILQEIRNGNQALSSKLDAKTAEINQSISGLKAMLDTLNTRTTEAESRISIAEDQLDWFHVNPPCLHSNNFRKGCFQRFFLIISCST